jgi:predicted nucleotidyltransferase
MSEPVLKPLPRPPVDEVLIQEIVRKIVAAFNPRRIILFGSRARGSQRGDSDIDLFIEMESELHPVKRRTRIRELFWPPPCAMDLLVYTPREVAERQNVIGSIVRTILREGRLLYEQTNP